MSKLCIRCGNSGMYLGNGMMMTECELCNAEPEHELPALEQINRNSKSYLKAIRDIMAAHPDISRKEAIKMFDEAYVKG